jgi:hypothetical protein
MVSPDEGRRIVLPEGVGLAVLVIVLMGSSALYIVSTGEVLKVAQTVGGIEIRRRKARDTIEKRGVAEGECCAIVPFRRRIGVCRKAFSCLQNTK